MRQHPLTLNIFLSKKGLTMLSNNTYIITEQQRLNFKPTYLYIKQHTITGKKYFGKTTRHNLCNYTGSGEYWLKHINKHGKEYIITIWYELFTNIDELVNYALKFSLEHNIVESNNWANLKPENGLDGGLSSKQSVMINNNRVKNGTHHFLNRTEEPKLLQLEKIKNGTHPWVGPENNKKLVELGLHPFSGGEIQRKSNKKRVDNGTHHLLGGEIQRETNKKRVDNGTHHLLGSSMNKLMLENGTHPSLYLPKQRSERQLYKEVSKLYKQLNIKIPGGTNMKSDEYLLKIKLELQNKLIS